MTVELTVEGEFQEARAVVGDELSVSPRPAAPASALSWAEEKPTRESIPTPELRTFSSNGGNVVPENKGGIPGDTVKLTSVHFLAPALPWLPLILRLRPDCTT